MTTLPSQLPELRQLMQRDHGGDIERLNVLLNRNGYSGLENVPPAPFAGDIDAAMGAGGICLIGINPQYPARRKPHELEIRPTIEMVSRLLDGDEGGFDEFVASRLGYFRGGMANWVHYAKLGEGYARSFFPGEDSRSVWDRGVFAADILPYWSRDTSKISFSRLKRQVRDDPALALHQKFLSRLIATTRPSMIHVNGNDARKLVDEFYCSSTLSNWRGASTEKNLMFGYATIEGERIPVMAHNQFGQWTTHGKYWPRFVEKWNDWRREEKY